jgi:2'-5' RNA ligase
VTLHTIFEAIIASEASITEFTVDTLEEHSNRQLTSISNPFDSFTLHEPLLIGVESLFAKLKTLKLRFQTQQKHRQRIGAKASFLPFITLLRRAEQIETLILEFGEPEIDRVEYMEDYEFQMRNRLDIETLFGDATFPRL